MHPSNKITEENMTDVVYWHPPTDDKATKYKAIADASYAFMKTILDECPDCADRSAALRAARESRMWANSSIALDE